MVLLVLWVPATSHCYLELAGIVRFDDCCAKGTNSPGKGDPCENCCKLLSKATVKIQGEPKVQFTPVLAVMFSLIFAEPSPVQCEVEKLAAWPPDTLQLAQFVVCTVFPTRAPSLS